MKEVGVLLGGPQGSGIETSMWILGRILVSKGFGVIADREYFSNITGRHSYILMLVSSVKLPRSLRYPVEILASMDAETVFTHFTELSEGGILIYDVNISSKRIEEIPSMEDATRERIARVLAEKGVKTSVESVVEYLERDRRVLPLGLDFSSLLKALSEQYRIDSRAVSKFLSGVIVSSVAVVLGLGEDIVAAGFRQQFREREELVEQNIMLYRLVRSALSKHYGVVRLEEPRLVMEKVMVVTGNDVVAIGKIVAGVRYQSYYPITPAADESFLLEKYDNILGENGEVIGSVVVMQTEDEIAAVNSAIGAALTGVRSSTTTSGPGFDLMIEGLTWAGMNEVPIVITYYQRGGPSTGQPTRGSQSDLFNAIFAGHGEFARVVLSSGDHLDAFYDTIEAFNIAEKYQVPVIHLLDKFLANTVTVITIPDVERVRIERGVLTRGGPGYKRFSLESLISPRAFIGGKDTVMWYTGDEHDEYGHIVEDPEVRARMYSKRIEKLSLILRDLPMDRKLRLHGPSSPDYLIIGWGSVKGVVLDAVEYFSEKGLKMSYLDLKLLWPFPSEDFLKITNGIPDSNILAVEHSYGVNIAELVAMNTGRRIVKRVSKYTGRPITLDELIHGLEEIVSGKKERVVLSRGA
ncbi:2-oxoacid:ferredoxin oxidoreductase subunit alpha [Thermosphaera aggregans]|uniref:2-oxoacid oxidoreductase (ferredoxin) n=1 Tax=Thermosphaera aggregans (strain DSM 11486 / M11TL) TaxID=633148 RepID=D5U329_THEAM|nr:2-oxoacid:ferredoxin oxidoreductase subunit alpha [Thermosphaera aggregans]ADG91529.1 2-oxoglutarate synthase [Thermosphaera aggregans DSM 11486]